MTTATAGGRRSWPRWCRFVVGYAAIAWLLRYVSTKSYLPFVIYRIGLGTMTLGLVATGVLSA